MVKPDAASIGASREQAGSVKSFTWKSAGLDRIEGNREAV
jgi:hypothetical protein